jgi:exodeoxyribonuclease VII small subunit
MSEQSSEAGPGFDQRLARLEAIVAELEAGKLGLEPAIERYQEGILLLKQCHGALSGFRRRVEELTLEAEAVLRPFDGDPDAEASGPQDAG